MDKCLLKHNRPFSKKETLIEVKYNIYSSIVLWRSVTRKFKIILENKDMTLSTDKTI